MNKLNTRQALIIHPTGERLVIARRVSPFLDPNDPTYPLAVTPNLFVDVNEGFAVQPVGFTLRDRDPDSRPQLEALIGAEAADLMYRAHDLGVAVLPFAMQSSGRQLVAELQIASPLTPPYVKDACNLVLGGLTQPQTA